ncbi:hypothetical protein Leryth_019827 [Lithospermum erythrorhizon]|uniref:Rapid alkalinization factor n=1 Tax=Lithospermum erythrorhizon TaxID=34254 RepID=A0AAV3QTU1_LITER|nr:hypothetical protein Leryth_019827 [Lithospermum erythrorhizon]
MAIRLGLALFLVALASSALLAESSLASSYAVVESGFRISEGANAYKNGLIGDCINEEDEMMMDSEASRRQLAGRRSRISRDAMRRSATPCGRRHRGGSYYGCPPANANPYRRGCNRITMCQRNVR